MRLCFAAVFLSLLAPVSFGGEQPVPYTAFVTAEDVYVRSGPGKNYYPTSKLKAGDTVEVYRHDPGGWYAIKPPEGSFTWISGRYLELGEDGLAKTTGDRVAGRVGSRFSEIRDVIQVRLHRGEVVEVLDANEAVSGPEAGTWYKIAPPSGEFRWVSGKFVDPAYPHDGVRKAPAEGNPLIQHSRPLPPVAVAPAATDLAGEGSEGPRIRPAAESPEPVRQAGQWTPSTAQSEGGVEAVSPDASGQLEGSAEAAEPRPPVYATRQFFDPVEEPPAPTRRTSPEEFQTTLDDLEVELSIMLVEEPTVWTFDELGMRARSLLAHAETALERGRARVLVSKIAQSEDVKQRYDVVAQMRTDTERHNRQLADLSRQRGSGSTDPEESTAGEDRFDGVGKLTRVEPASTGAPRYALLDEQGEVRCYVTPAPGVKMQYYMGRQVGVSGIRGYITDQNAQHVTAKHVSVLDRQLR